MLQRLQQVNLAHDALQVVSRYPAQGDLLDSNRFACLAVYAFEHLCAKEDMTRFSRRYCCIGKGGYSLKLACDSSRQQGALQGLARSDGCLPAVARLPHVPISAPADLLANGEPIAELRYVLCRHGCRAYK